MDLSSIINPDNINPKEVVPVFVNTRGPYRNYRGINKSLVLNLEEQSSAEEASKLFHIPKTTILNWKRKRESGQEPPQKGKRIKGAGTHTILPKNIEEELVEWISDLREDGIAVTRTHVRTHALSTYSVLRPSWKCSQGWMDKFLYRWKLSLRVPTEQKGTEMTIDERNDKIRRFWRHVISVRTSFQILPENIYNMDEVPVYFDNLPRKTLNKKGSKFALVKTTGSTKKRCTVVLTTCANGQKLSPMIIFKGKNVNHPSIRRLRKPRNVSVLVQPKAWMDSYSF